MNITNLEHITGPWKTDLDKAMKLLDSAIAKSDKARFAKKVAQSLIKEAVTNKLAYAKGYFNESNKY